MNFTLKLLLFSFIVFFISCSSQRINQERTKITIGKSSIGRGFDSKELGDVKIDAAFNLAMTLSGRYSAIDIFTNDSIAKLLKSKGENPSVLNVAQVAGAQKVVFLHFDRFNSIIRADMQIVDLADTSRKSHGEGYAYINFRDTANAAVLDPSLLTAVQRAFSAAIGDTALFAEQVGKFNVRPAAPLVIAGIKFSEESQVPWDLVEKKIVSSYSAVETIFEAGRSAPDFVFWDTETRDSVYTIFKLFSVENYNLPTMNEIDALRKFKVEYYIAGSFHARSEFADIELTLFHIEEYNIQKLRSVKGEIKEDKLAVLNEKVKELTKKLLKIDDN